MSLRLCGRVLALCLLMAPTLARAQEAVNTASISGRVTDLQGTPLPGALVIARHSETNVAREAIADEGGRFRLPYLAIGRRENHARTGGGLPPCRISPSAATRSSSASKASPTRRGPSR